MSKIIKIALIAIFVIFVLLLASNPNSLKGYTAWMFEGSEGAKVLPDLSNEEIEKVNSEYLQPQKEGDISQEKFSDLKESKDFGAKKELPQTQEAVTNVLQGSSVNSSSQ